LQSGSAVHVAPCVAEPDEDEDEDEAAEPPSMLSSTLATFALQPTPAVAAAAENRKGRSARFIVLGLDLEPPDSAQKKYFEPNSRAQGP